jgi:hypothetical protein
MCLFDSAFALFFEDDGMLRFVAVLGLAALDSVCDCCFCCPCSVHGVYVLQARGSIRLVYLCANKPLYVVCMSLADHSLTLNLTIFELMWTLAFLSLFSDSCLTK